MKLPEFGVKQPVATAMAFAALLLLGVFCMFSLPLDLMPRMEFPSLTVITIYPGASSSEVEQQVTQPLEAVLAAAENLKEIKSSSKENVSFIQLRFAWGSNVAEAANNARDLMELVKAKLPSEARSPIIYKLNSSTLPAIGYAVSATSNYDGMEQVVEEKIAAQLRKVDGVATVLYLGQPQREIQVLLDPQRAKAYQLSSLEVATLLKASNKNIPAGNITVPPYDFAVRMPAQYGSLEALRHTLLFARNGHMVRLGDVAQVTDGFRAKQAYARNLEGEGMALMVQKQSDANTVEVVRNVRAAMARIQRELPADFQVYEILASDVLVTGAISSLVASILYALLFVTLVVLAFLRKWRSSLIIFVTMPVSLIAAFIAMYLLDFTINIFSLLSLIVAIGMVVDNAIVVLENVTQHLERGSRPDQAALFGTSEMGLPIAASTLTTIVVFLPLLFMGGIVGMMFKQLALLTVVCLLVSLLTALTLTPMLASKLLEPVMRGDQRRHPGRLYAWSGHLFEVLESGYSRLLGWATTHKAVTIGGAMVLFVVSLVLGRFIGQDYIPTIDTSSLMLVYETEQGSTTALTDSVGLQVLRLMEQEVPEIEPGAIACVSGQTEGGMLTMVGFKEGKNVGTILCRLVPAEQRARTGEQIARAVLNKIRMLPGVERVSVSGGSVLATALLGNKKPVEFNITGDNLDSLNRAAFTLLAKVRRRGEFKEVSTTATLGSRELHVALDKEKASAMGLNSLLVGLQLRGNIYGSAAGSYTEDGRNYPITVRYGRGGQDALGLLEEMQVSDLLGQPVPLSLVASLHEQQGPVEIDRYKQTRIVKVTAELNGIALGDAKRIAQSIVAQSPIPQGVSVSLGGQLEDQASSFATLYIIFILGIVLVFMVMAAQFESLVDPFIILFTLPFTLVGVILAFAVTGTTLNVVSFIGVIMLVGIVVNNGIVLIDYTNLLIRRHHPLRAAVMEAGRSRLRPVLMTSFTTLLGMLPMALATGLGRELYVPLGITIIGGLLISTLVTLLLVPTVYAAIHRRRLEPRD